MAGSSARCLYHENMTLTFDLLTPKRNQFIFVPLSHDAPMTKSLAKIRK